jgi:hypothetical protein
MTLKVGSYEKLLVHECEILLNHKTKELTEYESMLRELFLILVKAYKEKCNENRP